MQGHSKKVMCVTFTPDGRRLLSGGDDNIIIIWDLASGQRINDIKASVDWLGNYLSDVDSYYLMLSTHVHLIA